MERRQQLIGGLMVALSGLSFGTLSVFSRALTAAGLSVPQLLTIRFVGGAAVLWTLTLARRELVVLPTRKLAGFVALGLLYVAEAWLYFESSQRIPIALTALLLYLFPSFVVVATWLTGEAPTRRGLGALALAMSGIALAVGAPSGTISSTGIALGAATALVYTLYILLGARVQPGVSPAFSSAIVMTVAALGFSLAALTRGPFPLEAAMTAWRPIVGLVVLGTALPIPLLLFGMTRIGASRASIISTLEPISAALCGFFFLDEALTSLQLVGAGAVLGAVLLVAKSDR